MSKQHKQKIKQNNEECKIINEFQTINIHYIKPKDIKYIKNLLKKEYDIKITKKEEEQIKKWIQKKKK